MNGVHDMGGMHGFGPIPYDTSEPVFPERWEARAQALHAAMSAWRRWDTDRFRYTVEALLPADYLGQEYYERRINALIGLLVETGLISAAELKGGHPAEGAVREVPALTKEGVEQLFAVKDTASRPQSAPPRFQQGAVVRTRNINPAHHTRLPRYARGKAGVIDRLHGTWVFPDKNAQNLGRERQHLYTVRFAARDLWGEAANPKDTVCIDLLDDYLEGI
jgi:nitrile hydratase beta subunit